MKKKWLKILRKRAFARLLARLGKGLFSLLLKTCRIKIEGASNLIETAEKNRCIVALWHNRISLLAPILKHMAPQFHYLAFVSDSHDGEILATYINSYPHGHTIRVPKQQSLNSLKQMISQLKYGKKVITYAPDGPRGPSGQVKRGVIIAAREAKAHIVPLTWEASRYWELKTWDKLRFPKPFSTIHVKVGDPLSPEMFPSDESTDVLQNSLSN